MAEEKHMSYWEEKAFEVAKEILALDLVHGKHMISFDEEDYAIRTAEKFVRKFRAKYNLQ